MIKKVTILIAGLLIGFSAVSQEFSREIGLRTGYASGLSGKVIKDNKVALEGLLGFRQGGLQMVLLVESYHPLIPARAEEWKIYFGGGGHVGWVNGYNRVRRWSNSTGYYFEEQRIAGPVVGLDGVFGTEYNFQRAPIVIFAEFKPFIELQSFKKVKVNFWDFGIGIRFKLNNN
ncbi:MAG: hypothetical protein K9G61_02585 [Bacteroidales bacterium]|nr:hypothetical protein [Bacteroidales bacterium]